MTDVGSLLLQAMRETAPGEPPSTRIGTIASVTATGATVTFDGEASASSRTYRALCSCIVGDRVLLLRAGSSWVVVSPITTGAQVTVPAFGSFTSASKAARDGNTVTLFVDVTATAAAAAGAACAQIPLGLRIKTSTYFVALDATTGASVAMQVATDGGVYHVAARANGTRTVGMATYVIGQ